jgi:hypothetical protein
MGLLCHYVFQPVIKLIQFVFSIIEFLLVQVCKFITELVNVLVNILSYICNTITQSVCGAVCGLICGICSFFCGIFGCDCGCENVCNNVCNTITKLVCGWTYILQWVLNAIVVLVCNYIVQAFLVLLHYIEAVVVMILTWICTVIDVIIQWILCWTYIAEIFNNTDLRYIKMAPKIVTNSKGDSRWFVHVANSVPGGYTASPVVDSASPVYILSSLGLPLLPSVDNNNNLSFNVVEVDRSGLITGRLTGQQGTPLLYYPYKVIEIADHLMVDVFTSTGTESGLNSTFNSKNYTDNLLTYSDVTQQTLKSKGILKSNVYTNWSDKFVGNASDSNFFGDNTNHDFGIRVDVDNCNHPTNTFVHIVNDIQFAPPNTDIAENMSCGAGQTLTFLQTNYLLLNKNSDDTAITNYFVSEYDSDDGSTGCNDLLGYTIINYSSKRNPIFTNNEVLPYSNNNNEMMSRIIQNIKSNPAIVRTAETFIHEAAHQCGLFHDKDSPDCENDATLHVAKVMNPGGSLRRVFTRLQWCMIWNNQSVTTSPFSIDVDFNRSNIAPELPDTIVPPTGGGIR